MAYNGDSDDAAMEINALTIRTENETSAKEAIEGILNAISRGETNSDLVEGLVSTLESDSSTQSVRIFMDLLGKYDFDFIDAKIALLGPCIMCMNIVDITDLPLVCSTTFHMIPTLPTSSTTPGHDKKSTQHQIASETIKFIESIRYASHVLSTAMCHESDHGSEERVALIAEVQVSMGEILMQNLESSPQVQYACKTHLKKQFTGQHDSSKENPGSIAREEWTYMDVIAMLTLFHSQPSHREDMNQLLEVLCIQKTFPFSTLSDIMNSNIIHCPKVLSALEELALYFVLAPIRYPTYPAHMTINLEKEGATFTSKTFQQKNFMYHHMIHTKDFVAQLFAFLPINQQDHLITSMLDLTSYTNFLLPLLRSVKRSKDDGVTYFKRGERSDEIIQAIPHALRKQVFPQSQCRDRESYQARNVFDIALIATWIVSSILENDIPDSRMKKRYKDILVERLYERSTSSLTSGNGCIEGYTMLRFELIEMICQSIVQLIHSEDSFSDTQPVIRLIMILQSLIFPAIRSDQTQNVSGLILAKHMVNTPNITSQHCNEIVEMVTRLIAPRKGDTCSDDEVQLDPLVGYFGLSFLRSLCPNMTTGTYCGECIRFIPLQRNPFDLSLVFKYVKTMLSRSSLVQSESSWRQNRKEVDQTTLGYEMIPDYFDPQTSRLGSRRMVFCPVSFLRKIKAMNQTDADYSNVLPTIRYVHCLIDTYLRIGRMVSERKWSPDGWLRAKLEVVSHNCEDDFSDLGKGVELNPACLKYDSWRHTLHSNNDATGETGPTIETLEPDVSLVHFMTASLASICLLCGVLNNAYSHWIHTIDTEGNDGTLDATRSTLKCLLHQMAKIYDLRCRYFRALDILERTEDTGLYDSKAIRVTSNRMREFIRIVFSDSSLFPRELLLDCLRAANQDENLNQIISMMDKKMTPRRRCRNSQSIASYVLGTYNNISEHLIDMSVSTIHGASEASGEVSQRGKLDKDAVLNLAKKVLLTEGIWRSLSGYEGNKQKKRDCKDEIHRHLKGFSHSVLAFLRQDVMEQLHSSTAYSSSAALQLARMMQTESCGDVTVSYLVSDLLSLFSVQHGVDYMSHQNWDLIIESGTGHVCDTGSRRNLLPYAFALTIQKYFSEVDHDSSQKMAILKILKYGIKVCSPILKCSSLCYHLLSQWGHQIGIGADLYQLMQTLLSIVEGFIDGLSGNKLNEDSFPVIFETLLVMNMTSFALSKPTTDIEGFVPTDTYPYSVIENTTKIFGSLLKLTVESIGTFSNKLVSVTIKRCVFMLKAADCQVEACELWRTRNDESNHTSTTKSLSMQSSRKRSRFGYDSSIHRIKRLYDNMESNVVEAILSFHQKVSQTHSTLEDRRALRSLSIQAEKLLQKLHSTDTLVHRWLPSTLEGLNDTTPTRKLTGSEKYTKVSTREHNQRGTTGRSSPISPEINQDDINDKSDKDEIDSLDDWNSFEVTGDWESEDTSNTQMLEMEIYN